MTSQIHLLVVVFTIISLFGFVSSENKKVPNKENVQTSSTFRTPLPVDSVVMNPNLDSLWMYHPFSYVGQDTDEVTSRGIILRLPQILTKVARSPFGIDPYFDKEYFQPFERRRRPVTVIALRKKGIISRVKVPHSPSSEIAELQSSFNDISNYWQDDPEQF